MPNPFGYAYNPTKADRDVMPQGRRGLYGAGVFRPQTAPTAPTRAPLERQQQAPVYQPATAPNYQSPFNQIQMAAATALPGGRIIQPPSTAGYYTTPGGRTITPQTAEQKAEVAAVGYDPVTGWPNPSHVENGHLLPGPAYAPQQTYFQSLSPEEQSVLRWPSVQNQALKFRNDYFKWFPEQIGQNWMQAYNQSGVTPIYQINPEQYSQIEAANPYAP